MLDFGYDTKHKNKGTENYSFPAGLIKIIFMFFMSEIL
jgi:hypothetical protein